jgi:hypothetical protein
MLVAGEACLDTSPGTIFHQIIRLENCLDSEAGSSGRRMGLEGLAIGRASASVSQAFDNSLGD